MRTQFEIQNLKCEGCANTILDKVRTVEGVDRIEIDMDQALVVFDYQHPAQVESVRTVLARTGYPIAGDANPLLKKAKSFVSCAIGRVSG